MKVLPEWWNEITTIAQDTAENFWFGSTAGIIHYNLEMSRTQYFGVGDDFAPFQEMGDTPPGHITDLLFDADGNLWISQEQGTDDQSGLRRYDGKKLTTFLQSEELPMNSVHNIMQDSRGNLWVIGVQKLPPTLQENGNNVRMISREAGVGVSVYNGKTFQNFGTDEGLPSNLVYSVFEDSRTNLWFATDGGIAVGAYLASPD